MVTPRNPMPLHEQAMDRAVEHMHAAEHEEDYRVRDSYRMMASVYVSMAKELRLGKTKSRTYTEVRQVTPAPPPPIPAIPRDGEAGVAEEQAATV